MTFTQHWFCSFQTNSNILKFSKIFDLFTILNSLSRSFIFNWGLRIHLKLFSAFNSYNNSILLIIIRDHFRIIVFLNFQLIKMQNMNVEIWVLNWSFNVLRLVCDYCNWYFQKKKTKEKNFLKIQNLRGKNKNFKNL